MTREEAIKIIRKMLACTDLSVRANLNADMVSACNLAIKALEQEPCEDCISRQAALGCCRNEWEEEVEMRLKSLPPVTPHPRKGHWILGGYDDDYYYICDRCNYKASEYYFKPRYNYCPNCGARMTEPQESEE